MKERHLGQQGERTILMDYNNEIYEVMLSKFEVSGLINALNESLESLDEWEYQTRMGLTEEEASKLITKLKALMSKK